MWCDRALGWRCPNPLPDMVVDVLNTGIVAGFRCVRGRSLEGVIIV
ncbi:hypothetical protein [Nostoc sp. CALU 1950]